MKTQAKGNSRFIVCARLGIALVVAGIGAAAFAETFRASRPVTDRAGSSDFCTLGETFELK